MPDTAGRHKTYPEEIVALLRRRILSGELKPGERLPPERELAPQLGTNRNTLREALRNLEAQGLIKARHGDGVWVLDFRRTGELGLLTHYFDVAGSGEQQRVIVDLFHMRTLVAREIVEQAARAGLPEAVAKLPNLLAALEHAVEAEDAALTLDAEMALYRGIVECKDSILRLWLFNSVESVTRAFLGASPGFYMTPPGYLLAWQRIVGGIITQQPQQAVQALLDLLKETDARVLALLDGAQAAKEEPR